MSFEISKKLSEEKSFNEAIFNSSSPDSVIFPSSSRRLISLNPEVFFLHPYLGVLLLLLQSHFLLRNRNILSETRYCHPKSIIIYIYIKFVYTSYSLIICSSCFSINSGSTPSTIIFKS